MTNHVRLRRAHAKSLHNYEARVTPIGSGSAAFTLKVRSRHGLDNRTLTWFVDSDDTRWFPTLKRAREYIDTFFEEA